MTWPEQDLGTKVSVLCLECDEIYETYTDLCIVCNSMITKPEPFCPTCRPTKPAVRTTFPSIESLCQIEQKLCDQCWDEKKEKDV